MDSRIPTDRLDVRANLPKKYKKSRIGEPATFVLLALLTAAICALSWPGAAQDGPQGWHGDEERIITTFDAPCWPERIFKSLMWQRWRFHEFGKGIALPPEKLRSQSRASGQTAPMGRFWVSEDLVSWAWSYHTANGMACLVDHGSGFSFRNPLKDFGDPASTKEE